MKGKRLAIAVASSSDSPNTTTSAAFAAAASDGIGTKAPCQKASIPPASSCWPRSAGVPLTITGLMAAIAASARK